MEISWTLVTALVSTILIALYWYSKRKHSYWLSRGIPGPDPLPLFGNILQGFLTEPHTAYLEAKQKYGKIYGHYVGYDPTLNISDPELVKQMMVKDFDKFVNRRLPLLHDVIGDESLFQLEDDKWKAVRSITSPTFTSGKLRGMQPLMNHTVDKLIQCLDKVSTENDRRFNAKEVIGGFTMDTIALTSFATETDANGRDQRSTSNQNLSPFLENAANFFKINFFKALLILFLPMFMLRMLNVTMFFGQKSFQYFVDLCRQILRERTTESQNQNLKRNDLVQLLLDASIDEKELAKIQYDRLAASAHNDTNEVIPESMATTPTASSTKRKLTENELIAQCIVFMLAGYETTASTISHLLYELAINQATQDQLYNKVSEALDDIKDTNSKEYRVAYATLYFDTVINGIPLLDATIKETLRKYPALTQVERRVGVDGYKLGGVELFKNQVVEVAVYTIHHSEEYYPEPERFNPDRFMPKNRHLLVPYTYLPFGTGPRNCVGMRFAYQEMKLALAQLVIRYRFEPTVDTTVPLQFNNGKGFLTIKSIPLNVSRR